MTRDEIMAMRSDELDAAIYVIPMGWATSIIGAWQLELSIPADQRHIYAQKLNWVLNQKVDQPDYVAYGLGWEFAHASPKDRCRAYLMWKEGV